MSGYFKSLTTESVILTVIAILTLPAGAAEYQEEDLCAVTVAGVWQDPDAGDYTLVFEETEGTRYLVMGIGSAEAVSIAIALEDVDFGRPLTHDLLVRIILALGGELERVIIDDLHDEAFYARLELVQGDQSLPIDCRPSDATALALRFNAPIFATDQLLERAMENVPPDDTGI